MKRYLLTIRMKVFFKKKLQAEVCLCWCSTRHILDWGQLPIFGPFPVAKVLAILKRENICKLSSCRTIKRKSKKQSRKKRKFTLRAFQTLTRFSSSEACLVGLNLYTTGVVSSSKRQWARPFRIEILKIRLDYKVSITLRIMLGTWTYWQEKGCFHKR